MKITHINIYRPDGQVLDYELGEKVNNDESIDEIYLSIDNGGLHPVFKLKKKEEEFKMVELHFVGFPFKYRCEYSINKYGKINR